jgi:hypothetical protein
MILFRGVFAGTANRSVPEGDQMGEFWDLDFMETV